MPFGLKSPGLGDLLYIIILSGLSGKSWRAGEWDLLWWVVAHEVDSILPRLAPHVHAWTHMDRAAHAVGGGPDDLQTTNVVHERNDLH